MIRFVLDACVPAKVGDAADQWSQANPTEGLDVVSVGRHPDLPADTPDPDILEWAARHGRVVVTVDYNTMPGYLDARVAAGGYSPGVLCVRPGTAIPVVIESLVVTAHAGRPDDLADMVSYIPL